MYHGTRQRADRGTFPTGGPQCSWLFHTCRGEIDLAADWYEKAIEERDALVFSTMQTAIGEPVRASARWPKLAALMNLPE